MKLKSGMRDAKSRGVDDLEASALGGIATRVAVGAAGVEAFDGCVGFLLELGARED